MNFYAKYAKLHKIVLAAQAVAICAILIWITKISIEPWTTWIIMTAIVLAGSYAVFERITAKKDPSYSEEVRSLRVSWLALGMICLALGFAINLGIQSGVMAAIFFVVKMAISIYAALAMTSFVYSKVIMQRSVTDKNKVIS